MEILSNRQKFASSYLFATIPKYTPNINSTIAKIPFKVHIMAFKISFIFLIIFIVNLIINSHNSLDI